MFAPVIIEKSLVENWLLVVEIDRAEEADASPQTSILYRLNPKEHINGLFFCHFKNKKEIERRIWYIFIKIYMHQDIQNPRIMFFYAWGKFLNLGALPTRILL